MKSRIWKKTLPIEACRRRLAIGWAALLLGLPALHAEPQMRPATPHTIGASFPIPVADPVYRDIELLMSLRLVDTALYAQRPWTAQEFQRLTEEAEERSVDAIFAEADEARFAAARTRHRRAMEIIARVRQRIEPRLTPGTWYDPLTHLSVNASWQDQPQRRQFFDNHLATVIAEDRSFRNYQNGLPTIDGPSVLLQLQQTARFGRSGTCLVDFAWRSGFDRAIGDIASHPQLQQGRCQAVFGNVEISLGREAVVWGQSDLGGILLSGNARPLDQIRLSTARPFYHPWWFRHLGPSKYTFLVARLESNRVIPNSYLVGSTVSIRPQRRFEFSFFHTYLLGGAGSPEVQWYDPLTEFVFVRAPGSVGSVLNLADHRAGISLRWDLPKTRGMALYAEGAFEDFGRVAPMANIVDMTGYIFGLSAPRLDAAGRWSGRIEYRTMPPILFRHGIFSDGHAAVDRLLGDPLGPDGRSVRLQLAHEWNPAHQSQLTVWGERNDSNFYTQTTAGDGNPNQVVLTDDNPAQWRVRTEIAHTWQLSPQLRLTGRGGYQHVIGDNFVPGQTRNDWLASAQLQWTPAHWRMARHR